MQTSPSLHNKAMSPRHKKNQKTVHFSESEAVDLSSGSDYQYSDTFESDVTRTDRTRNHRTVSSPYATQTSDPDDSSPIYSDTFEPTSGLTYRTYTDTFESSTLTSDTASQLDSLTPEDISSKYLTTTYLDGESPTDDTISSSWTQYSDEEASLADDSYTFSFEPTTDHSESHLQTEEERNLHEEYKQEFIQNIITRLTHKPISTKKKPAPVKEKSDSKASRSYCRHKIQLLKDKKNYGQNKAPVTSCLVQQPRPQSLRHYGMDPGIINRLKLQNMKEKAEKFISEPIHEPRTCRHCCTKQEELDEKKLRNDFLKSKILKLETRIMEEKMQQHLIKMNSVNLIGEIARSLPKHSAHPLEIESQLNKPLRDKMMGT